MIFLAARNFSGERLNSSRFLVQWLTTEFIFTQSFAALKIVKLQFLFGMINSNLYPISFLEGENPVMAAILLFWKRNWGEGTRETTRENRNVGEEKAFKTGRT